MLNYQRVAWVKSIQIPWSLTVSPQKNVSPFFMFNKPAWTLTWGTSDCSYDHQTQRLTMINYTSPLLLVYKPPRGVWFKDDAVQPHVAVVGLPLNPWIGFYRTICRTTTIFHGKFHGKKIFNGKIYKKSLHLMVNTMVFCRFSLKPIQWLKMLCLSFTSAGNYYHFTTVALARLVTLLPRLVEDESLLVLIPHPNKRHGGATWGTCAGLGRGSRISWTWDMQQIRTV